MPNFDPIQVVLTTANGALVVTDVTLSWKGSEDFVLDGSPLGVAGLIPKQPFSLELAPFDPSSKYRVAKLKFKPEYIGSGNWHVKAFNPCVMLVQKIRVTDVGPKDLIMNFSCTEHPVQVNGFLANVALAGAQAVASAANTTVQFLKNTFGEPEEGHELQAPPSQEASTSPR